MQADISQKISLMANQQNILQDETASYGEVKKLVSKNLSAFKLDHLKTPEQVVLSLTWQATMLTDLFIWCTCEESVKIAQTKLPIIQSTLTILVAHLVYLADLLEIDLAAEYMRKMAKNNAKYPVANASGSDYEKIKDAARESKK